MKKPRGKIYRNGRVHVLDAMCRTCIFRPGNLMELRDGCVQSMVEKATRANTTIVCHETLGGLQAACHGFFKKYATGPLQIADRLGMIEWQKP